MFLPSTHSFLLTPQPITPATTPVFFPNSDSFLLIRASSVRRGSGLAEAGLVVDDTRLLVVAPVQLLNKFFLPNAHSFTLQSRSKLSAVPDLAIADLISVPSDADDLNPESELTDDELAKVSDHSKRNFLKVAGLVVGGVIASQFSPKSAHALIMGSSPTTGVVGTKNAANERINPATEETAATLLKTSDLTFDAGALQVKVTSLPSGGSSFSDASNVAKSGLVDADRHLQVDVLSSALPLAASTESTLQTISFGGFKFALRFATVGSVDYIGEAAIGTATSSALWRIKKVDSTSGISIKWAGTGVFDQIWDNHLSLTYS